MSATPIAPVLKGNGRGEYHIQLVGNSGTGKTTLANKLSAITGFKVLHLDQASFQPGPGWIMLPREQFRENIQTFQAQQGSSIIDGNLNPDEGDQTKITDIIWLDPHFSLYFPRLLWRTILRVLRLAKSNVEGCYDSIWDVLRFNEESILWWCWNNHEPTQRTLEDRMRKEERERGTSESRWKKFKGTGGEVQAFLGDVERQFGKQKKA